MYILVVRILHAVCLRMAWKFFEGLHITQHVPLSLNSNTGQELIHPSPVCGSLKIGNIYDWTNCKVLLMVLIFWVDFV